MLIFFLIILGLSGLITVLSIIGTVTKNRWGINLDPITCPNCGNVTSALGARKPKNLRQTLWGGATCEVCGTEYDKWGRTLNTASETKA
jgi:hypothetical protein